MKRGALLLSIAAALFAEPANVISFENGPVSGRIYATQDGKATAFVSTTNCTTTGIEVAIVLKPLLNFVGPYQPRVEYKTGRVLRCGDAVKLTLQTDNLRITDVRVVELMNAASYGFPVAR